LIRSQRSYCLLIGDYLRVTSDRFAAHGQGVDEGFARIERIELVPKAAARAAFSYQAISIGPVPVVWCHGVPGPVLLPGGDVSMLEHARPDRVQHDCTHPWWPPPDGVLLNDSDVAGDEPHRRRRNPGQQTRHIDWPTGTSRARAPHRATGFAKPASALRVEDYVRIHTGRWPDNDCDVDEGFARVEHLRVLDSAGAQRLFADRRWHTTVIIAAIDRLPGVLLLRGDEEITVMAFVNPERDASDRRQQAKSKPALELNGSRPFTEAEQRHADDLDAGRRPKVDEASWYPSRYASEFERRLEMEGTYKFRVVPLSALPWPHFQSECPLHEIAKREERVMPDEQAAHAAAFLSDGGQRAMASCEYHQHDWPRLVRILRETLDQADVDDLDPKKHPEYGQLSRNEQECLRALVDDPIEWSDRSKTLTNGQHRLCALRAAGIEACPVRVRFLPDTDYGTPVDASEHARNAITASWTSYASEHGWPVWTGVLASKLSRSIRTRLLDKKNT
jgi:hypothetical protein